MRRATVEQISIFGGLVGTPSRVDNSSNLVANMLRFAKGRRNCFEPCWRHHVNERSGMNTAILDASLGFVSAVWVNVREEDVLTQRRPKILSGKSVYAWWLASSSRAATALR